MKFKKINKSQNVPTKCAILKEKKRKKGIVLCTCSKGFVFFFFSFFWAGDV
jgi:hypothetical protein